MDIEKTLREVERDLGVKRRAVQGYEKAGLVTPSGKNKYGHLLYDEKAQERIAKIKRYQQFGFSIREIKELIDAPPSAVKAALEKQICALHQKREQIEHLIEEADELIRRM